MAVVTDPDQRSQAVTGPLSRLRWRGALLAISLAAATLWQAAWVAAPNAATLGRQSVAKTVVANQMTVKLTGHFHLLGRPGHVLAEQGNFTGTVSGPATIHFTLITLTKGTATVVFYPKGGSIGGQASTRSSIQGPNVYFGGVLSIMSGTGKWAHSAGSKLNFSGSFNRVDFQGTAHLSGSLHV